MSDLTDIFGADFVDDEFAPMTDFTLIPPGKYPVEIEEASVKRTKSENGHYIKLLFRVIDGEYKGTPLYENLNIDNPNNQTVEIAKRVLTAIMKAIGLNRVSDSAELVGGKLIAHVRVKNEQNQIRTFSSLSDFTPVEESASNNQEKPPWLR